MHRSYQPILPCGNKYLQQKWDQTYYDEHRRKVQSAKPMVDTNSPQTYVHLNTKLKKLKLEEERLSVIERDNRLLLEKMSHIMRTKGRVDNTNDYEAKSLNKEKREQELLRVSRENQAILERINKCEPQYQVERWHEDWVKAERYMDSIARYPRGWYITHQHKHSSKEGQKSSLGCSSATAKEGTVQSGRRKESLQGSHNNKRGVTRKETVNKKDGKTIILKQTQSVRKHEKENKKIKGDDNPGRDKDAVSDTEVDEQSTDEAAAEAAVNKEPTDNTTVNGNLADVAAENEYLKDEHEDYTEDDNEKEGTSESEKEEESDSEKEEESDSEKEGGSESDEEAEGEKKDDSDN